MANYLDLTGLTRYDGKIKGVAVGSLVLSGKQLTVKSVSGQTIGSPITLPDTVYDKASATADGLMSKEHFVKVEGISEGANKVEASSTNGYISIDGSDVKVYAPATQTALTSNMYKITTNAQGFVTAGEAVTKADIVDLGIPAQDTTYEVATQSDDGLMSAEDKTKLDGIAEQATKVGASDNGYISINGTKTKVYAPAAQTALSSGLYKITTNAEGFVTAGASVVKADITALGIPAQDTTYELATADADGLMSSEDFTKLAGMEDGAQENIIETVKVNGTALPVSSKVVNVDLSAYALKSEIAAVIHYKGSVANYAALPTNAEVGDMYNVEAADAEHGIKAGDNVVWSGTAWDNLGGVFTINSITNAEIDALFE